MKPIPESFIKGLASGVDAQSLIQALQENPPVSIRKNPGKDSSNLSGAAVPWEPLGVYLNKRPSFTLDPHFHAGAYYVQEAGSMMVGEIVRQTGLRAHPIKALDLCAAPGGKTTHLASTLHPASLLVANEYDRKRAKTLQENLEKWGDNRSLICSASGEFWSQFESCFDLILLDAPCSGEGMFRKDEFAREQWSEGLVKQCSAMQQNLLEAAWNALAPGGYLLYSTCTFNLEENEDKLSKFFVGQELIAFDSIEVSSSWGIESKDHAYGQTLRFYPHLSKSEGFTISIIRKSENTPQARLKGQNVDGCSRKEWELMAPFLKSVQKDQLIKSGDGRFFLQQSVFTDLTAAIIPTKACLAPGLEIGSLKGKDFIPAHGLAMSSFVSIDIPVLELDLCQALSYLKGETQAIESREKGWCLMQFEGARLGWAKLLPNRMNNYYPKNYRIRMAIPEEICS
jgi:16S rRNA C967 or C1407 C5-methylase (RsmB/RsmF family)/NOL1/NOP2/fmu family ribosome biogenesis protein